MAGVYVLRLTASDGEHSSYDELTITVNPQPEPTTVRVHDLDAQGVKLEKGNWKSLVTITLHDGNGQPVADAAVKGSFYQDGSFVRVLSCKTGANGQCSVDSELLPHKKNGAEFIVDDVFHPDYDYEPSENHDHEGDSDGTAINLAKQ